MKAEPVTPGDTECEIRPALERVFRSVLRISAHEDMGGVSTETHGEWDSLTHLNLVLAVEQEFRVRFSPEEVGAIRSFEAMLDLLCTKSPA